MAVRWAIQTWKRTSILQRSGLPQCREVELRIVPDTFISDVIAKPVNVLESSRAVNVTTTIDSLLRSNSKIDVITQIRDINRVVKSTSQTISIGGGSNEITFSVVLPIETDIELWQLDNRKL